jgi:hypothetical protein
VLDEGKLKDSLDSFKKSNGPPNITTIHT